MREVQRRPLFDHVPLSKDIETIFSKIVIVGALLSFGGMVSRQHESLPGRTGIGVKLCLVQTRDQSLEGLESPIHFEVACGGVMGAGI